MSTQLESSTIFGSAGALSIFPGDLFFDESLRKVEVVSVDMPKHRFYIHYVDEDKRMDRWIAIKEASSWNRIEKEQALPQVQRCFTRTSKRRLLETNNTLAYLAELDSNQAQIERSRDELFKVKNVESVHFGGVLFQSWYYSPYPEEIGSADTLHVCRFCFKYMRHLKTLERHQPQCRFRQHPPGALKYRTSEIEVWEVSGLREKLFCQNLCLFAKLFLDHKSLYYLVDEFLFYLLYLGNGAGALEFVGYFSKEQNLVTDHNLSCILTLPSQQRKGWGRFLIHFSYALSRAEKRPGTPERPLSDLGTVCYRKYWCSVLTALLSSHPKRYSSVKEIAGATGFLETDVHQTLLSLGLLRYWKDEYILDFEDRHLHEQFVKYYVPPEKDRTVDSSLIVATSASERGSCTAGGGPAVLQSATPTQAKRAGRAGSSKTVL